MAKETKAQLEYMNGILDQECQKKMQEVELLKGIISLMLKQDEVPTKMFKLSTPDPLYIKIENDWCTIIRETKDGEFDATMQEENEEVPREEHKGTEQDGQTT